VATVEKTEVLRLLGSLPPATMRQVEGCLKAALELP
jgi:hypothetical protein